MKLFQYNVSCPNNDILTAAMTHIILQVNKYIDNDDLLYKED